MPFSKTYRTLTQLLEPHERVFLLIRLGFSIIVGKCSIVPIQVHLPHFRPPSDCSLHSKQRLRFLRFPPTALTAWEAEFLHTVRLDMDAVA